MFYPLIFSMKKYMLLCGLGLYFWPLFQLWDFVTEVKSSINDVVPKGEEGGKKKVIWGDKEREGV